MKLVSNPARHQRSKLTTIYYPTASQNEMLLVGAKFYLQLPNVMLRKFEDFLFRNHLKLRVLVMLSNVHIFFSV